ncbi:hypothetical protein ACFLYH_02230 [Candidatus Dependentiae bacterium]
MKKQYFIAFIFLFFSNLSLFNCIANQDVEVSLVDNIEMLEVKDQDSKIDDLDDFDISDLDLDDLEDFPEDQPLSFSNKLSLAWLAFKLNSSKAILHFNKNGRCYIGGTSLACAVLLIYLKFLRSNKK